MSIKILEKDYDVKDLVEHESFCVLPWIHFHAWPEGTIYPCCMANSAFPVNRYEGQSMSEIMNNAEFKKMRLDMLSGKKPKKNCDICYKHEEKFGSFGESHRQQHNKQYLTSNDITDVQKILESTDADGNIDFKMLYVDIRFSNICNLKCRSCSPHLSSAIAAEQIATDGSPQGNLHYSKNGVIRLQDTSPVLLNEIIADENIDKLRKAYFAGGEPLVSDEHYAILTKLIERKKTNINILYNTNFTNLTYRGTNVLDIWKNFPFLNVGTSIDDIGKRVAYLRNGAKWDVIKKNFDDFKSIIPDWHWKIYNSITVSLFNVFYLDEIITEFLENIKVSSVQLQMVFEPEMMCVTTLPADAKAEITKKLNHYIDTQLTKDHHQELARNVRYVLEVMNQRDTSHLMPTLGKHTYNHDFIRKENFAETYPELESLIHLTKYFP